MLTNRDRREILEQVKTSGSGDIIAALRGQVYTEPMQTSAPTQEPVNIPQSPQPVNVDIESTPSLPSNLVDSTASLPTQLAKKGGIKKYDGGLYTADPVSTYVSQNFNIPTIEKPLTELEQLQQMVINNNTSRGTVSNYYDKFTGNNPNKQWISGASNQMYASNKAKQRTQDYNETILGFAAPVPLLNSMKVSASGAKIPGLIDDVILGPLAKGYGKVKSLIKPKTNTKVVPTTKGTKTYDEIIEFDRKQKNYVKNKIYKPSSTELDEIQRLKNRNIKYIQSDEYVSKRMANTGESKESILSQVKDYIKELNETPITFQTAKNMDKGATLGFYRSGDIFENIPSQLQIKNPAPTNSWYMFNRGIKPKFDSKVSGTVDHEIKHLLSPTQKLDKTSSTYKLYDSPKFKAGRKKYSQALDDINDKFMKATSKEEADRILNMYNKVPNKEIFDGTFTSKLPNMDKVYKNYPTLNIKSGKIGSAGTEASEYLGRAQEQQPRLLRGAEWLKSNFKWDGTKSGMTDDMLKNIFNQMENSTNLGGKTKIPNDFRELLENTSNVTYSKLKDVLSKAWAVGPVAVGVGAASEKKSGGFKYSNGGALGENLNLKKARQAALEKPISYRQHMMNYANISRDTNQVNMVMNAISEHESFQDPKAIQVSQRKDGTFFDGPGRGLFQFENLIYGAGNTAMNRNYNFNLHNTEKSLKDFPNLYNLYNDTNTPDFSKLSKGDQEGLFIGDKILGGKVRRDEFDALVRNRTTDPTSEEIFMYWLRNHKGASEGKKVLNEYVENGDIYTGKNGPIVKREMNLTKEEIQVERKKWKSRTKNMFK